MVTVLAPATRDSVQARITVRPGAPARLAASPADTALYVGHSYPLEALLFDTYDNPIAIDGLTFTTDSASVAIGDDGNVTGLEIGRAGIVAHVGALTDTVWASVVPEGRIAAVEYGGSGGEDVAVVLINLDGSDYRRFPVGQSDIPRPAWHPSGAYLVASIHAAPGAPDAAPRLAALDTSTGEWSALGGTPDAAGDGYAQFSHDGTWIYVANAPTNRVFSSSGSSVYRVRADGSGEAEIVGYDNSTDASQIFDHPSPSPDGSRVAMTVEGSNGMYTLIAPASPPLGQVPLQAELLDGLPTGGYPTWSPVGEDILMFGTEGMWIMRAGAQSIDDRRYLAQEWSTTSLNITGGFSGASWSPDGSWIVARAHAGMILVEVATDRVLPLTLGGLLSNPAWRPQ
jgi:Tol biopolymer transport system component